MISSGGILGIQLRLKGLSSLIESKKMKKGYPPVPRSLFKSLCCLLAMLSISLMNCKMQKNEATEEDALVLQIILSDHTQSGTGSLERHWRRL